MDLCNGSTPSNPTGSVYLESELKAIAEVISKHPGIIIVADEIYEYINFTGKHISIKMPKIINL